MLLVVTMNHRWVCIGGKEAELEQGIGRERLEPSRYVELQRR